MSQKTYVALYLDHLDQYFQSSVDVKPIIAGSAGEAFETADDVLMNPNHRHVWVLSRAEVKELIKQLQTSTANKKRRKRG